METYNFWRDLLDTYQSLPQWLQFAWLVVPPAFVLGLLTVVLHFRAISKRIGHGIDGEPLRSVLRDGDGRLYITGPRARNGAPAPLVLPEPANRQPDA